MELHLKPHRVGTAPQSFTQSWDIPSLREAIGGSCVLVSGEAAEVGATAEVWSCRYGRH